MSPNRPTHAATALRRRLRHRYPDLAAGYVRLKREHRVETLTTYSLDTAAGDGFPNPHGLSLHEATVDNLAEMKASHPREFTNRKYAILADRVGVTDERCYLIADGDGTWCGYSHMATTDNLNERIGHLVEVGPSDVYLFDSHVFRAHRRMGLHTFSIARRMQLAGADGRSRAWTTITSTNEASIASFAQFGLRPERWLVHLHTTGTTLDLPARSRRASDRT